MKLEDPNGVSGCTWADAWWESTAVRVRSCQCMARYVQVVDLKLCVRQKVLGGLFNL